MASQLFSAISTCGQIGKGGQREGAKCRPAVNRWLNRNQRPPPRSIQPKRASVARCFIRGIPETIQFPKRNTDMSN